MRKRDELTNPDSCMMRALDGEMTFTLLGRDKDAPGAVRDWIARRIASGSNQPDDSQMIEAEQCAQIMEAERDEIREEIRWITTAIPAGANSVAASYESVRWRSMDADSAYLSVARVDSLTENGGVITCDILGESSVRSPKVVVFRSSYGPGYWPPRIGDVIGEARDGSYRLEARPR